jgi:hypothetical protein
MHWADFPQAHTARATLAPEIEGAIPQAACAANLPNSAAFA